MTGFPGYKKHVYVTTVKGYSSYNFQKIFKDAISTH